MRLRSCRDFSKASVPARNRVGYLWCRSAFNEHSRREHFTGFWSQEPLGQPVSGGSAHTQALHRPPLAGHGPAYAASISLDRTHMQVDGRSVGLRPEMAVTVEIN